MRWVTLWARYAGFLLVSTLGGFFPSILILRGIQRVDCPLNFAAKVKL